MKSTPRFVFLLLACTASFLSRAQEARATALLQPVSVPGFYQIGVTPELSAYTKEDLSNIRILDEKEQQVPYVVRKETGRAWGSFFLEFPLLSIKPDSNKTIVEVQTKGDKALDALTLLIANTAAERFTSLSGSNDLRQWYAIADRVLLHSAPPNDSGQYAQTLFFPGVRYRYLRLIIDNEKGAPVNIMKAGTYTNTDGTAASSLVINPSPAFGQKEEAAGQSLITIRNKAPYLTDRIMLEVKGPKFYQRKATLYELAEGKGSRKTLASFTLSSGAPAAINLEGHKGTAFLLAIENGDNPPLQVTAIQTGQLQRYLVTYLEKDKRYRLAAGNEEAKAPKYDLASFSDSIPNPAPPAYFGALSIHTADRDQKEANHWLWPAILTGIATLGFLTFRLVKEINMKEAKS